MEAKTKAPKVGQYVENKQSKDSDNLPLERKTIITNDEILKSLLKKIDHVKFADLVFSRSADAKKITQKHYYQIVVEVVLEKAKINDWGLCKNNEFIYLYNGFCWVNIDKDELQLFWGVASLKMGVDPFLSNDYEFREKLFKQFLSTGHLSAPKIDKNTVLINLKNGTFEITPRGFSIRAFNRNDFLTYQLPFEYDKQAKAPIFEKFLNRVLPDIESQNVLAEYLGFIFIKHGNKTLKEEKAAILYGTGANGKSVVFEVVSALLGEENTSNYSLSSLTNDNGYYRAQLANKLVNYASEINGKLEASIFKQLVSGEPVEARLPYGKPFILRQYAKLIFNANELPKDVEHTNAFFRRFLIIPFNVTIPEKEQDKNLHTKIIENELSGVFNWVLSGLTRLLNNKSFTYCESSINAIEQFKTESDSVKMFIDESNYKTNATHYELIKDLYLHYRGFCGEDGFKPVGKTNFIKRLKAFKVVVEKKNIGNVAYLHKEL